MVHSCTYRLSITTFGRWSLNSPMYNMQSSRIVHNLEDSIRKGHPISHGPLDLNNMALVVLVVGRWLNQGAQTRHNEQASSNLMSSHEASRPLLKNSHGHVSHDNGIDHMGPQNILTQNIEMHYLQPPPKPHSNQQPMVGRQSHVNAWYVTTLHPHPSNKRPPEKKSVLKHCGTSSDHHIMQRWPVLETATIRCKAR